MCARTGVKEGNNLFALNHFSKYFDPAKPHHPAHQEQQNDCLVGNINTRTLINLRSPRVQIAKTFLTHTNIYPKYPHSCKMPAPSQLKKRTLVVHRLVEEEKSYLEELATEEAKIKAREEDKTNTDENSEFEIKQLASNPSTFAPGGTETLFLVAPFWHLLSLIFSPLNIY